MSVDEGNEKLPAHLIIVGRIEHHCRWESEMLRKPEVQTDPFHVLACDIRSILVTELCGILRGMIIPTKDREAVAVRLENAIEKMGAPSRTVAPPSIHSAADDLALTAAEILKQ